MGVFALEVRVVAGGTGACPVVGTAVELGTVVGATAGVATLVDVGARVGG